MNAAAKHVGTHSTLLELGDKEGQAKFREFLSKADVSVSNRRMGWRERFNITSEGNDSTAPGGLIDAQTTWAGETGPSSNRVGSDISATFAWASTTLRVATRSQRFRRSVWPATK